MVGLARLAAELLHPRLSLAAAGGEPGFYFPHRNNAKYPQTVAGAAAAPLRSLASPPGLLPHTSRNTNTSSTVHTQSSTVQTG